MRILVETQDLMSIPQAAELMGKPRVTVWRWAKTGRITTIVLGGRELIPREVAEGRRATSA